MDQIQSTTVQVSYLLETAVAIVAFSVGITVWLLFVAWPWPFAVSVG